MADPTWLLHSTDRLVGAEHVANRLDDLSVFRSTDGCIWRPIIRELDIGQHLSDVCPGDDTVVILILKGQRRQGSVCLPLVEDPVRIEVSLIKGTHRAFPDHLSSDGAR